MDTSLLDRLVSFAQADEAIRAVILEGSLAAHFQVDELLDYDINIYAYESYQNGYQVLVDKMGWSASGNRCVWTPFALLACASESAR